MNCSKNSSKETCSNSLNPLPCSIPCIKCCDPLCPEPPPHTSTHPHSVVGPGTTQHWSLEDSLALLTVVAQCGYGCWEEVARLLPGRQREARDIQQHYDQVFVCGDTPYPEIQSSSFSAVASLASQPSQVQYFPLLSPSE